MIFSRIAVMLLVVTTLGCQRQSASPLGSLQTLSDTPDVSVAEAPTDPGVFSERLDNGQGFRSRPADSAAVAADGLAQVAVVTAQDPNAQVNVRSLPSQQSDPVGYRLVGEEVQLGRSETAEDGHLWYAISLEDETRVGWIRSDFLEVQPDGFVESAVESFITPSATDSAEDALKTALDDQCGGPKAVRAYFVTANHTIYLCQVRQGLVYLSQEQGTQQVIVAENVQVAGGGYIIVNDNYEYRLDSSGLAIVRMDEKGREHDVLQEAVTYSERYDRGQS